MRRWKFSRTINLQPNTDRRERSVEAAVFGFGRIDAAIHRAEEEIGAITETDFALTKTNESPAKPPKFGTMTVRVRSGRCMKVD